MPGKQTFSVIEDGGGNVRIAFWMLAVDPVSTSSLFFLCEVCIPSARVLIPGRVALFLGYSF